MKASSKDLERQVINAGLRVQVLQQELLDAARYLERMVAARDEAQAVENQKTRVTITFDLLLPEALDDDRAPLTWGRLRKIIDGNTPAMESLEVREGLTEDIVRDTAWGKIRVSVE